jgi:hypothetical protein
VSIPRLRRRYRATGSRRGFAYLFLFLGIAALYVGIRVYTERQVQTLVRLDKEVSTRQVLRDSLLAERDHLNSFAVVTAKAEELGLVPPDLNRLARVPLSAPVPAFQDPATSVGVTTALAKVWHWLDTPELQSQEVQAAP